MGSPPGRSPAPQRTGLNCNRNKIETPQNYSLEIPMGEVVGWEVKVGPVENSTEK